LGVARLLAIARGAWGAALLIAPDRFLAREAGQAFCSERAVARILGARQLAEAGILLRAPKRRPPIWAIAVDLLHAASMLAVAAASPTLRRDALRSAVVSTALSALSASQR
jgi:hypothetical protein